MVFFSYYLETRLFIMIRNLLSAIEVVMNERDWIREATPREREVSVLVAQGCSNPEIAARLGISPHTARGHVSNIMLKLNVYTRAQIAFIVGKKGWTIDDNDEGGGLTPKS